MAVVSRITTLTLSNAGSTRTWQATAAVQDTAAGASVAITTTVAAAGLTPPGTADTLSLSLRIDDSQTVVRTYALTPGSASQVSTFFFTVDGVSGSALRSGTLRLRIDVDKSTGALTDRYTANSDNTTGQALPALWSVQQRDQGWVRSTTSYTTAASNVAMGGAKNQPAQFPEDLHARTTLSATAYRTSPVTVSLTSGASTPRSSSITSTATFDRTWSGTSTTTGRVNRGFPALLDTYTLEADPGNATLTGLPWTVFTSSTADTIDIDPRLTCVHLMQLDDNSYGTPPLTKQNASGERPATSIGYIATAIHAARGSTDTTNVVGGVNGISLEVRLAASSGAGTPVTRTDTTVTAGGESGWQSDFLIWTSSLPGGSWDKNVTVTGPADIGGVATYLIDSQAQYQLLAARDPFVHLMVDVGHADSANVDRHVIPGDTIEVAVYFKKTKEGERQLLAADTSPTPAISFERIRAGVVENWNGSAWVVASPSLVFLPLTNVSTYVWSTTVDTDADWGDVVINVAAQFRAVQYDNSAQKELVGSPNGHDDYRFDGAGFVGFPSK